MNQFSSTLNNNGLLKDYYEDGGRDAMLDALKSRRNKLKNKVTVPTKEEIEGTETQEDN